MQACKVPSSMWSKIGRLKRSIMPRLTKGSTIFGSGASPGIMSCIAGRILCDTYLCARDLLKEVWETQIHHLLVYWFNMVSMMWIMPICLLQYLIKNVDLFLGKLLSDTTSKDTTEQRQEGDSSTWYPHYVPNIWITFGTSRFLSWDPFYLFMLLLLVPLKICYFWQITC